MQPSMSSRPDVGRGSHPVETGRYCISTRAINELGDTMLKWIENRVPGGIITGRPRLGKTRAVQYLSRAIPQLLNDHIPLFTVTCNRYRIPSENTFYSDVLMDLGLDVPKGHSAGVKRDRICKHLISAAQDSNQRRVIVVLGDAQRLGKMSLEWLMDIHNQLDRHDVTRGAFLVGQPELVQKKKSLLAENMHQLVGRFMVFEHQFRGVQNADDVLDCLDCYDSGSEYPIGSGWSFTRYFFPTLFDKGFRLANYAEDLWNALEYLHREANLGPNIEIPMQYLTVTVQHVLTKLGEQGENVKSLTIADWKNAVRESGYILAERYQPKE